ncbi:MAG TPA: hypothetical protein PLK08_04800, partial [Phycisphaerae bacterium]|nr:hypothetical protein [Phycisphaerae bacterium]
IATSYKSQGGPIFPVVQQKTWQYDGLDKRGLTPAKPTDLVWSMLKLICAISALKNTKSIAFRHYSLFFTSNGLFRFFYRRSGI